MYELANPICIKEMPIFNIKSCIGMMEKWLNAAYSNGVNVPELNANVYVYNADDMVFSVEYVKMICNLSIVFREIYDNKLYELRLKGLIDKEVYNNINFHQIFGRVNDLFNYLIEDQDPMYEFAIYHSEISLEIAIAMYDVFNDSLINELKKFIDVNLLKYIFSKYNTKYIQNIYDSIFNKLENVFSIYY